MSSIYTYDQVKEEFNNHGLKLVSTEYDSATQKLQYYCNKHKDKGLQEIDFKHLHYRNQGCKYCGREKTIGCRTLPEDIVKEKAKSMGWEYIGRTISGVSGGHTIIHVICPKHREKGVQDVFWSSVNSGRGCKYCSMNVQLTTEEYKQRIKDRLPHINILSEYTSQKTKVTAHCKIHNITWRVLPYDLLRENACGCSECAKTALKNHHLKTRKERIEELRRNNPTIELLSKNVQIGSTVKFKCMQCGNVWNTVSPQIYFNGRSICPVCARKNGVMLQTKTDDEFRKELNERLPHIVLISTYVNSKTPVTLYCTKHNYSYVSMPQSVLGNKNGCPKCLPKYCENLVAKYLDGQNIQYIREYKFDDCMDKRKLPFDYYLPDYNFIIEYDGEDHYMPINRNNRGEQSSIDKLQYVQNHDRIKTNYCLINNIHLIRIPYWEKENIDGYLDENLMVFINNKIA